MKKWRLSVKAKQILSIAFLVLSVASILLLIGFKGKLTEFSSNLIKSQANSALQNSQSVKVDSEFNYAVNGLKYKVTFLEFGAKGCSACKRMEGVMSEVRNNYSGKVNVLFINILLPENQNMMKYFGIAAIPTQVLLDRNGHEFFRHSGFYPAEDLSKEINPKLK
jgi:thioredoxin 1